ncbi:uncharacterized protein LOC116245654 isoform X2 [Nymphaea colorata]|nr:uncharacterized protein LOC116245654 isoform X2 [Nymphaea colorata]
MAVAFVKVLSILVVALLVVPGGLNSGQVKAEDCRKEKEEVISLCGKYALKRNQLPGPPPAACCSKIKASDIACVCRALTPAEAKNYNMTLTGRVLRECGYAVHAGFKCGGDIVPEA